MTTGVFASGVGAKMIPCIFVGGRVFICYKKIHSKWALFQSVTKKDIQEIRRMDTSMRDNSHLLTSLLKIGPCYVQKESRVGYGDIIHF